MTKVRKTAARRTAFTAAQVCITAALAGCGAAMLVLTPSRDHASPKLLRGETMTPCLIAVNGRRALLLWLIAGGIALLQACAIKPQTQYKVSFCNMEAASVSEVRANYGGTLWELPALPARPKDGDERCLGGYSVTTMQALPEAMALKWTLAGRRLETAMPIKSRLNGIYPTSGLQVIFQNGRVELFEYVYPANNHLVRLRIYPPVAPKPKPEPKNPIRVTDLRESWTAQSEFTAVPAAGQALSPAQPPRSLTGS